MALAKADNTITNSEYFPSSFIIFLVPAQRNYCSWLDSLQILNIKGIVERSSLGHELQGISTLIHRWGHKKTSSVSVMTALYMIICNIVLIRKDL